MRTVIKSIVVALALASLAFGFGRFRTDQPFLAADAAAGGGEFSPDQIPNLIGWYTSTNTFRLDGTTPSSTNHEAYLWKNQVADNYHFRSNGGNSLYPTNRNDGSINGSNYMVITLSDAGFAPGPMTNDLTSIGTNFSIYAVMKVFPTASFNNQREVFNSSEQIVRYIPNQGLAIASLQGAQTLGEHTWFGMAFVNTLPSATIYTNCVPYITNGITRIPLSLLRMGVPGGNNCNGGFAEILVYDGVLTSNQIVSLQGFYRDKFGIPSPP